VDTLFPLQPAFPEGFSYFPDFLSLKEEQDLFQLISTVEFHSFRFQGFEAKRRVAGFGYDYSFDHKVLTQGAEIPKGFEGIIQKTSLHLGLSKEAFSELLVTEYPVGSVINWHRDAFPFEIIAGISLMADCVFKLRPYKKEKQGRGSIISVLVKRRSLYVIRGKARMEWEHSTAPVKNVRYSVTLRTIKEKGS
jgi:alkylated DNA repair dioxygenase AlkB